MDDIASTITIPNVSISEELLKELHLDETQSAMASVLNSTSDKEHLSSDGETNTDRILDRFEEISLMLTDLQIQNTKLWSKLEELHDEVDVLRAENKKLRDEIKSQWGAIQDAGLSSPVPIKKIIGHRGIDATGQTTYKQTPASALQVAIQLGIAYTVQAAGSMDQREVLIQDFEVVESIFFPRQGSKWTPPHHYKDFHFKIYAPFGFYYFRERFGIHSGDFRDSLCDKALIELSNSGASGSLFYLSSDDKFILKTVQCREAEFLQRLLPGYYNTLLRNRHTLLPKFYGLFCVCMGGKNIRIVVMNNLHPTSVPIHFKYDLKGSTHRRQASRQECSKQVPTYKDLDFLRDLPNGLLMEAGHYDVFRRTIHEDCLLLQSFRIMDYSLLVAIHKISQGEEECSPLTSDHSIGVFPVTTCKGEKMLVFTGIIDVLQSYRLVKKLEHSWKSLFQDGEAVSVHQPGFYAVRFEMFLCEKVFKRTPAKSSLSKTSRLGFHYLEPRLCQSRRSNLTTSQPSYTNKSSHTTIIKNSTSNQATKAATPGISSASLKQCHFRN
ncbi:hypothetical protein ACEWY4_006327 [Coilia grayii]|uniref:PIPK domain-containing protein n=1 Tax=Coilia grayii TaxID=363190 RepID=A0ABD1KD42_9TELE